MRKVVAAALSAAMAVTLTTAAASGANPEARQHARSARTVVIMTRKLPKLGAVLVNSSGRTLYMFAPDKRKKVACTSTCQSMWPVVKLPKGAQAVGKKGVKSSLLGSDSNPDGGRVITYNRWPLYTYVGDSGVGSANGQALNVNGGLWYVISPTGRVIHAKR